MRRVLLIEDNPIEGRILRKDFQKKASAEFDLIWVTSVGEALQTLKRNPIDVILLDLFLDDSSGLETLSRAREAVPDTAIVVLTGLNDEALALEALKRGAQDYLIKGTVDSHVLFRSIRYAIERKQAESDRRLLEQRLLQGQKLEAVGTLAAGVAHNFNNALTVILGHSKLMREGFAGTDGALPHVESIIKCSEKAAALIRQLLTFSRKRTAEPVAVSLNKLILDMHMLIESTLDNVAELELKLNAEFDFIKANQSQIGQMLMNLAINARSAMPSGGKLTIETSNCTVGEILLTIRDTGCGMSPETCAHAFEPFFTTKSLAEASGLGLSTAYGIVKQHGGDIQISSKLGEGTVFSITFPTLGPFATETKQPRPSTILLVYDAERSPDLCFNALDGTGEYSIIKASSCRDAIEAADAHSAPVDLLIADGVTPGFLRQHLLNQLATERPEMKIICISDSSITRESLLRTVTEALSGPCKQHTNARALGCVAS